MASPKLLRGRSSSCGGYHSITTVVSGRRRLFSRAGYAQAVQHELRQVELEDQVRNFAWMLMPDHLHWMFQLRAESLGKCMQRFKSNSARVVNRLANSSGALWQAGYYDHQIRSEDELIVQARYVLANPLRSGLVRRIEDYPWWWCACESNRQDSPW